MPLIERADRTVPVTVQARSRRSPSESFAIVVPIDLPSIFRSWGPLPGVSGTRDQTGSWDHVGATRTPLLTDGTTARETLTEYSPGQSFAYEITDFDNVLGRLAVGVRGEWTFTPDGDGTAVRWTYEFKPRPGCFLPLRVGLAPVWRQYMARCLAAAIDVVDRSG